MEFWLLGTSSPALCITRFRANGSWHLRDLCRRLGLLVDLCLLCLVLWPFPSRGGVGRAVAAEKASGESLRLPRPYGISVTLTSTAGSGLVSGRYFGASDIKLGRPAVGVGRLEVRCCFAAVGTSKGIHLLVCQVNVGLGALKAPCEAVAHCCQGDVGHVLYDVADFVLEPLQLQSMCRLYGAPLLQGSSTGSRSWQCPQSV